MVTRPEKIRMGEPLTQPKPGGGLHYSIIVAVNEHRGTYVLSIPTYLPLKCSR
jgi:hypothetical protein